jgi:hypothetical protein
MKGGEVGLPKYVHSDVAKSTQGKEMVLNDKETFVEKMPNAIRESGGRFKVFAHDSEGNRMAFDTDTGVSEVTCSDGNRRDISILQAKEVLDRAKSPASSSPPGGKSFTIDESAVTGLITGWPKKTPQATEIPLGDLPSPIQEICTPSTPDKSSQTRRPASLCAIRQHAAQDAVQMSFCVKFRIYSHKFRNFMIVQFFIHYEGETVHSVHSKSHFAQIYCGNIIWCGFAPNYISIASACRKNNRAKFRVYSQKLRNFHSL